MKRTLVSAYRLLYLSFVEEFNLIRKDFGAWLILLLAVIIYPIIYSIGYYPGVLTDIPIAVVDMDQSSLSRKTVQMLDATPQLVVEETCTSMDEAENYFWDNKVKGVVYIPNNFEKSVYDDVAEKVAVYCDGSYFLIYKETLIGALKSIGTLSGGIEIKKMMSKGATLSQAYERQMPIQINMHSMFNPNSSYLTYVVAGVILVIIQQTLLIGIGLIAGSRREIAKKHFNLSYRIPKGFFWAVVLGRSILYVLISLFNVVFNFVFVSYLFGLPFQGHFIMILCLLIPFILSSVFLGLALSQLFKEREHAIIFLAFFSPIVLFMTGLSWPKFMIPDLLNWIAHFLPSTHVVPSYIRLRAMGAPFIDVSHEFYTMLILTFLYFILATFALRYRTLKAKRKRHLSLSKNNL